MPYQLVATGTASNIEKLSYDARYYREHREQCLARAKRHYQERREEILARSRELYQQNREKRLAQGKRWRLANPEKVKARLYRRHQLLKFNVLSHYSVSDIPGCARCGVTDLDVLCIDHIDNSRWRRRDGVPIGVALYRWLVKNNFPEGFQVLCANCNLKKAIREDRRNALPIDSNRDSEQYRPTRAISEVLS